MVWFLDRDFLARLDLRGYDPERIAARTGVPLEAAAAFVTPDYSSSGRRASRAESRSS